MPDPDPVHELARAWLWYAEGDLRVCRGLRASVDEIREPLAFHAQQAIEKALKAILVARQIEFPRTHDLVALYRPIADSLGMELGMERLAVVSEYAVEQRCPAAMGGLAPDLGSADVLESIELAETVVRQASALLRSYGIDIPDAPEPRRERGAHGVQP